jgi:hypothetical protein
LTFRQSGSSLKVFREVRNDWHNAIQPIVLPTVSELREKGI